jgi:hypothetical protein
MKTMSKSDLNKLNGFIKENVVEIPVEIGDGNKITILCKNYLPLEKIMAIVSNVITFVTSGVDDYVPEFADMATGRYIIEELTNIPLPTDEDGNVDYEKCYDIYTRLDLKRRMIEADEQLATLLLNIDVYIYDRLELELDKVTANISAPKKGNVLNSLLDFITKASEDPNYLNTFVDNLTEKYLNTVSSLSAPSNISSFHDDIIKLRQAKNEKQ